MPSKVYQLLCMLTPRHTEHNNNLIAQNPIYLPQYIGHPMKGSTTFTGCTTAWCSPQTSCGIV